jgi:hypothetical protein
VALDRPPGRSSLQLTQDYRAESRMDLGLQRFRRADPDTSAHDGPHDGRSTEELVRKRSRFTRPTTIHEMAHKGILYVGERSAEVTRDDPRP